MADSYEDILKGNYNPTDFQQGLNQLNKPSGTSLSSAPASSIDQLADQYNKRYRNPSSYEELLGGKNPLITPESEISKQQPDWSQRFGKDVIDVVQNLAPPAAAFLPGIPVASYKGLKSWITGKGKPAEEFVRGYKDVSDMISASVAGIRGFLDTGEFTGAEKAFKNQILGTPEPITPGAEKFIGAVNKAMWIPEKSGEGLAGLSELATTGSPEKAGQVVSGESPGTHLITPAIKMLGEVLPFILAGRVKPGVAKLIDRFATKPGEVPTPPGPPGPAGLPALAGEVLPAVREPVDMLRYVGSRKGAVVPYTELPGTEAQKFLPLLPKGLPSGQGFAGPFEGPKGFEVVPSKTIRMGSTPGEQPFYTGEGTELPTAPKTVIDMLIAPKSPRTILDNAIRDFLNRGEEVPGELRDQIKRYPKLVKKYEPILNPQKAIQETADAVLNKVMAEKGKVPPATIPTVPTENLPTEDMSIFKTKKQLSDAYTAEAQRLGVNFEGLVEQGKNKGQLALFTTPEGKSFSADTLRGVEPKMNEMLNPPERGNRAFSSVKNVEKLANKIPEMTDAEKVKWAEESARETARHEEEGKKVEQECLSTGGIVPGPVRKPLSEL